MNPDRGGTRSIHEFTSRAWRGLSAQHLHVAVVSIASGLYGIYYWSIYGWRPGFWQPMGYQSWADQSSYLIELRYLAAFSLPATPDEYLRGLGYPLVGVPFEWMGFREDPLLPANIVMLAVAMGCTYVVATRLSLSRSFGYVTVGVLLFASPLVELVIVPWSTTVTIVSLAVGLVVATSPKGFTVWGAFWLGTMAGWAFAARYLDVIGIGAVCVWYLLAGPPLGRIKRIVAMGASALVWAVLTGLSLLAVHGSLFSTGYTLHQGNPQSLEYYSLLRVPRQFWETFVTAISQDEGRSQMDPLFLMTPILVLLPLGAALVLRGRLRGFHAAVLIGSLIQGTIYLAGAFGGAHALWFRSPRFWISSYPYWVILSLVAAVWIFRRIESKRLPPEPEAAEQKASAAD